MRRIAWLSALALAACAGNAPTAPFPATDAAADAGRDATSPPADTAPADAAPLDTGGGATDTGPAPADVPVARDADDRPRTTLRVHYPSSAGAVTLRGSGGPLSWTRGVALERAGDGVWSWTSRDVTEALEWKPMLRDEVWSRGPNYRVAPGATVDVWPHFVRAQGEVTRRWPAFASTLLGNTRGIWVYLPPTYLENPASRFPVVYMHDGQNLFDPRAAFGGTAWRAGEAMDEGAETGQVREAILVGVENTAARIEEYTPTRDPGRMQGGRGDLYLRMLIEEVKPMIDRELRTLAGREDTAVVGSSLGGLISSYAGVRRPDVFGLVGALSPSTWWDDRMLLGVVASVPTQPSRALRVYVDSGDSGASRDDADNTRALAEAYRRVGYVDDATLRYVLQRGAEHNEYWWSVRLPGALRFLLGPRR